MVKPQHHYVLRDYDHMGTARALEAIGDYVLASHSRLGFQSRPDSGDGGDRALDMMALQEAVNAVDDAMGLGTLTWREVLNEKVAAAYATYSDESLRKALAEVGAVLVCWIKDIDRRPR